jgi:hypothetical protein
MRESQGILGKLYRDLSNEKSYKEFMTNQYKFQVCLAWELDPNIMKKVSSIPAFISYLSPVYEQIVKPMERQIRELMFIFRQHSEAALFASDLNFHISSASTDDIASAMRCARSENLSGQKPNQALVVLNMKLHAMVDKFKDLLEKYIARVRADPENEDIDC